MKASYDPEADALSIRWSDAPYGESNQVEPGVILDYDKEGNVIGVEILFASQQIKHLSGMPVLVTPIDIKLPPAT